MVFFNWATMQMAAKIVYYGPGLCGKTSNLSYIYAKTSPNSRGEMVSLETESDRTLFFDLLPIEVGTIGGFKTRLQLYTVPGQVFYNTTRKLVLKGVDGVVFVADSQRPMREANLESFESLRSNLRELGLGLNDLPLVLQFNKRDLKNILTVEEMVQDLNADGVYPHYEASAINGDGVFETLKEITKLTLKKLRKRMASPQTSAGRTRPTVAPVRPEPAATPPRRPASISAAALARAAEEGVESDARSGAAAQPPQPRPDPPAQPPEHAAAPPAAEPPGTPQPQPPPEPAWQPDDDGPAEAPGAPPAEGTVFEGDVEEHAEARAAGADEGPPDGEGTTGAGSSETAGEQPPAEPFGAEEAAEQAPTPDAPARDEEVTVEFARSEVADEVGVEPPPMKRVQVSNQMDILAELDDLRKQSTTESGSHRRVGGPSELDLDSLLGGAASSSRELRRKLERSLNSNIFDRMHGVQIAVRIQDAAGDTIHTLDPVSLRVEEARGLKRLSLRLTVDLENTS